MRFSSCLVAPASLLVGLSLVACDSDVTTGGGGQGGGTAGGAVGGNNGEGGSPSNNPSFTVTFDPITVQPGEENTQCVTKRLGNDTAIHVHEIHNVLPQGSHHLIVYRTADTEEKLEPYDCQPFADTLDPTKGSPLMVTQKHDDKLTLPDGVAFSLAESVMVRLEMHYINPTSAPLDVGATSTFTTMPDADFHDEADFLFIGNPDIDVPAHGTQTLGPTFIKMPPEFAGVKFFGLTGHTHQWGTNVTVAEADSEAGPDTMLYDVPGWQWSEPATVMLDPPLVLPDNAGFRFTCEWDNQGDTAAQFGESANDEMCFFWAYYYPSQGAHVCAHTDQFGSIDGCCPGNALCDFLF